MKRSKKMFTVMLALCVALSMAMASVTANAATKKPKKIYLKATSTTVDIKGKVKVSVYKTKPSKASKSVKWKSSNKKVATVSKSGYVTGKKKGTVKITATSKKNKKAKKTIKIKVKDLKAKSVTMSKTSAILFPNDKTTLKATVKGSAGFYNQGVTWKSSNTSVATVDRKGNVIAKKAGKATITATEKGGSKKATCAVTVSGIYEVVAYNYTDVDAVKAAQSDEKTVILDARKADDYKDAHIDGTVSADMDGYVSGTISKAESDNNIKSVVEQKGADKNYIIICYSGNRYAKAATEVLIENGVKVSNISILKDGMGAWRSAGEALDHYNYTNADTTFSKMKDSSYVILDARKKDDTKRNGYDQMHIPGAVSADVDGIVNNGDSAAAAANVKAVVDKYGKDKKYIVICYSGNKYAKVATGLLMNYGIKNANIQTLGGDDSKQSNAGGMQAWNAKYASYVVAKHISTGKFEFANGITPENLKADVDGQKVFTVMDVRAKDAFDEGHISNAVSAPSDDEAAVMKAVNDNKNGLYVLVCYSGNAEADEARNTMVNNGVDESRIICLQGGMGTWK